LLSDQIERDDEGIYTLMKKAFEETVGRYFAKLDYTHKSSGFLHLVGDKYTPTGWDVTGRTYYRLCGLSEIDEGIFRAAFDGFSFDEFDDFGQPDIYISKNMEALIKYAGDNNDNISRDDILLEIFKDSRYSEICTEMNSWRSHLNCLLTRGTHFCSCHAKGSFQTNNTVLRSVFMALISIMAQR
jgi:hypothetical protein